MMNKMNDEMLENVNGGTDSQSRMLVMYLAFGRYGNFLEKEYTGDFVDYAKLSSFFASKGYKFIPGKDDSTQNYFAKDGLTCTTSLFAQKNR